MRVALDVTPATTGLTGVARYTRELWSGLLDEGVDVVPFAIGRGAFPLPDGVRRVSVPLRVVQRSWSVTGRPRVEDLVGPVDLAHCLDMVPAPSRVPLVMTAHDVLALEHPELHSARQVRQQRGQLRSYARAAVVLANSRTTAEALSAHGVDPGRVEVVQLGLTQLPAPAASPVSGRYLLAVGELAARKNLPVLLDAFAQADLPAELQLVLVGPEGHGVEHVLARLGDRARALGRVPDDVLSALYAGATALCFPSLAEGFGLPVLEAMSAGAPVVCNDLPVMREVAGDAALFVKEPSVAAWSAALERVVNDQPLRARLAAAGRRQAAGRTWRQTAEETVAAYRRVLSCG